MAAAWIFPSPLTQLHSRLITCKPSIYRKIASMKHFSSFLVYTDRTDAPCSFVLCGRPRRKLSLHRFHSHTLDPPTKIALASGERHRCFANSKVQSILDAIYNSSTFLSCCLPSSVLRNVSTSFLLMPFATSAISSSYTVHSGTCLLALSSFGSLVSGLLHRSMVLAFWRLSSLHHVSHQSHSCGRL